jgi:hypothetical protein
MNRRGSSGTEDKVHGPEQTEPSPEKVELQGLSHDEHRKRDKHREGDDLLKDLELGKV